MSSYYTKPSNPADGDVAYASDIYNVNNATDAAFDLVEAAITTAQTSKLASQYWADLNEDKQIPVAYVDMAAYDLTGTSGKYSARHWSLKASASAASAALSNTYAAEWANKAEDSLVSAAAGGDQVDDYSALHWANKAQGYLAAGATVDDGNGIDVYTSGTSNTVNVENIDFNETFYVDSSVGNDTYDGLASTVTGGTNPLTGETIGPMATIQGAIDRAGRYNWTSGSTIGITLNGTQGSPMTHTITSTINVYAPNGANLTIQGADSCPVGNKIDGDGLSSSQRFFAIQNQPGVLTLSHFHIYTSDDLSCTKTGVYAAYGGNVVINNVHMEGLDTCIDCRYSSHVYVVGTQTRYKMVDGSWYKAFGGGFIFSNASHPASGTGWTGNSTAPGYCINCSYNSHVYINSSATWTALGTDALHDHISYISASQNAAVVCQANTTYSYSSGSNIAALVNGTYNSRIFVDNLNANGITSLTVTKETTPKYNSHIIWGSSCVAQGGGAASHTVTQFGTYFSASYPAFWGEL